MSYRYLLNLPMSWFSCFKKSPKRAAKLPKSIIDTLNEAEKIELLRDILLQRVTEKNVNILKKLFESQDKAKEVIIQLLKISGEKYLTAIRLFDNGGGQINDLVNPSVNYGGIGKIGNIARVAAMLDPEFFRANKQEFRLLPLSTSIAKKPINLYRILQNKNFKYSGLLNILPTQEENAEIYKQIGDLKKQIDKEKDEGKKVQLTAQLQHIRDTKQRVYFYHPADAQTVVMDVNNKQKIYSIMIHLLFKNVKNQTDRYTNYFKHISKTRGKYQTMRHLKKTDSCDELVMKYRENSPIALVYFNPDNTQKFNTIKCAEYLEGIINRKLLIIHYEANFNNCKFEIKIEECFVPFFVEFKGKIMNFNPKKETELKELNIEMNSEKINKSIDIPHQNEPALSLDEFDVSLDIPDEVSGAVSGAINNIPDFEKLTQRLR
jgi:hypothetical protein